MDQGTHFHPYPETDAFTKAEYLERFVAKFIDFLVMGALFLIPGFVGPLAGTTYILISDGINGGQSIGKKIAGLRVVTLEGAKPCDFKKSIIRNSPFGIFILFSFLVGWIPYLGVVLRAAAFLAIFGIEIALVFTDDHGARFGDRIAGTIVVPTNNQGAH